jgi:molybdopterin-guanine dinucleotide biosynthesis protein A
MGSDKCFAVVGGRPLYERQLTALRGVGASCVVVAPHCPAWAAIERVRWIPDRLSASGEPVGPLGGILSAMEHTRGNVLFLPIDVPAIDATWLNEFVGRAAIGRGLVPVGVHGYEPLIALYPPEAAAIAADQIRRGEFAVRRWVERLLAAGLVDLHPVLSESSRFSNLNCPEDVARWDAPVE